MGKIADTPLAFIDIETTGLDPLAHEVIEFAAICRNKEGSEFKTAEFKIKPEHIEAASPQALEVNGYTPEAWAGALSQKEGAEKMASVISGCILVGHNVSFDLSFIQATVHRQLGQEALSDLGRTRFVDTATLAHEHLGPCGLDRLSLKNVCDFIGVSNEGAHTALVDVRRCMTVYDRLNRAGWLKRLWWKLLSRES
jgi:DNA polymerase III alpha subunit (gram-positive type)